MGNLNLMADEEGRGSLAEAFKEIIMNNRAHEQRKEERRTSLPERMREMLERNCEEIRRTLHEFRLFPSVNDRFDIIPDTANLIVFGPTGSGKSSLIRTFFYALHSTFIPSEELSEYLIVKDLDGNEGTKAYTSFTLKRPTRAEVRLDRAEAAAVKPAFLGSTGISIIDTRGQILMDDREVNQLQVMLAGKAQNRSIIEQRNYRYAHLLWEFWKRDSELFPREVISGDESFLDAFCGRSQKTRLERRPHSIIIVFDGSLDEVPNGEEEVSFYRSIITEMRRKRYHYPQIVLTRYDKVEEKVARHLGKTNPGLSSAERDIKLREVIDRKKESVVNKLSVPRSCVHFIENYHSKHSENVLEIDYYALKLLLEAVKQSETMLEQFIRVRPTCLPF
eukprot:TRINITY_DN2304_c0_g2_i1.p1 TRINITY_DN2304_c0_g2~~TRINITY_DN2304_c0_g2_i1.p1  ORF type:complete len:392 (+),score=87.48 TRINITY_DN2304_c0_g2_i1:98-1273(+)